MINIKYNMKRKKFLLMDIGEAFVHGDCVYIKIIYIENDYIEYNALNLTNYNLAWVNDEILVEPVDLDITVKGA